MKISWQKTIQKYAGREAWGGLDLASVRDFTALSYLFEQDDDPEAVDILARFWCPESRLYANDNRYRDQYQAWEREGWLHVTDGDAVDYHRIVDDIVSDAGTLYLDSINVDRLFQGGAVLTDLISAGVNAVPIGQGWQSIALPMKVFEEKLLKKQLNHGGNPVLRFCADNVSVRSDPAGNLKYDKAQSQGKIDGIVAVVLALDRYNRTEHGHTANDGSGIDY